MLAAAAAAIPPELLARLRAGRACGGRTAPAGVPARRGAGHGRAAGRPASGRASRRAGRGSTWSRRCAPRHPGSALRREPAARRIADPGRDDFRVTRFKQRTRTTTIFVVDASGSAAFHRLAEAKGAVELLLADCYVRRDQVALLAFRGRGAELLLPPTRSLVRAKRSLAGLPGGGGTPLAAGIDAAAGAGRRGAPQGRDAGRWSCSPTAAPTWRATASAGRARAEEEALAAARAVRGAGLTALLVDTSPSRSRRPAAWPQEMGALYLPLPHADAAALSHGRARAGLPPSR